MVSASPPTEKRIVFLGDSITAAPGSYSIPLITYLSLRYPKLQVSYRNAGVSGDTAPGGLARLDTDVLSVHPTVVSICFGMNDAGVAGTPEQRYEKYMTGMTGLVTRLKAAGIRVVLLTPPCVDATVRPDGAEYNQNLKRERKCTGI